MADTPASLADVTVRPFQPEDEESLLQLLVLVFDGWPHREVAVEPIEYLRWKLSSSEEALRCHAIAEAASTIVGCRISRFFGVQAAGRGLRALWFYDAAVHPDFRRKRVMTRVRDLGLDLVRGSCDLQMGGYTRNPAIGRLHAVEERYPFANPIEVLERQAGATSMARADGPWTITAPARFDERIGVFWEAASRQFEFITVRDRQVLNWRYCDVRGGSFQVRLAEQEGRVLAYIVFRREHAKGYIADLLALPGREDALEALILEALGHFDGEGVSAVRCWLPAHHVYREVLVRHGFARRRIEKSLRWGPLRTPASELAMLADPQAGMHLTMGDSDLI